MEILGELIKGILLILPGFIFTFLVVMLYECKIRQLLKWQRNKVHFYVARDKNDNLWIYLGKPIRGANMFQGNCNNSFILTKNNLKSIGLNEKDYADLKWEDEPVEVFITLKD